MSISAKAQLVVSSGGRHDVELTPDENGFVFKTWKQSSRFDYEDMDSIVEQPMRDDSMIRFLVHTLTSRPHLHR